MTLVCSSSVPRYFLLCILALHCFISNQVGLYLLLPNSESESVSCQLVAPCTFGIHFGIPSGPGESSHSVFRSVFISYSFTTMFLNTNFLKISSFLSCHFSLKNFLKDFVHNCYLFLCLSYASLPSLKKTNSFASYTLPFHP